MAEQQKYKQMNASEQAEVIRLWRLGDVTLAELSKRFNRSESTLKRLFEKESVVKGDLREEHMKRIATAVEAKSVENAITKMQRLHDLKESSYKNHLTLDILLKRELKRFYNMESDTTNESRTRILRNLAEAKKSIEDSASKLIMFGPTEEENKLPTLEITGITDEMAREMFRDKMLTADISDMGDESLDDEDEDESEAS